ncbi:MAG: formylglycine-generating enzyme family protein [Treponema sp.]|nr:formylglycine-generating enzyme family protein [Treponema sp.]
MKIALISFFAGMLVLVLLACDNGNGTSHSHTWGDWSETTAIIETRTCSTCSETGTRSAIQSKMAQIPAGSVDLSGTYTANLSAFKMGKYTVTQAQYEAVTGNNPSYFLTDAADGEIQEKRPVEMVTWFDAIEFCNKLSALEGLTPVYTITGRTPETGYPITAATVTADISKNGYRLPTEAQWEYACRAGTTTTWFHGNAETGLENYAWYSANSNSKTHEVGKKTANSFGLFDMHGNVWEWCWDWYGTYPNDTLTDPTGAVAGSDRVRRGGCWDSSAAFAGSSSRYLGNPDRRNSHLGFRLVCP